MRLLLDECVPARLRKALPPHHVSTVPEQGWTGVKNSKLLLLAAEKFDALIPVGKSLSHQLNASSLPISVFVLDASSSELRCLLALIPKVEAALADHDPSLFVALRAEA